VKGKTNRFKKEILNTVNSDLNSIGIVTQKKRAEQKVSIFEIAIKPCKNLTL